MIQSILVVKVVPATNMSRVHAIRATVSCKAGEGVLFLNKRCNMARLVDSVQAVHTYYAHHGQVFDVRTLQQMVGALRLRLKLPDKVEQSFAPQTTAIGKLAQVK